MAKEPIVPIQNFNQGGLSDSRFSGAANSFYKMTGWDPHTTPGVLKVEQKLSRIAESLDEFCKNIVVSTNGYTYFFSAESGKIWQLSPLDVLSLVYTTAPTEGEAKCLGAFEYQSEIYWATSKFVHKIPAEDAIGSADWTANAVNGFGQFTNGDTEFHPMEEQNLILWIGDGNLVARINNAASTKFVPDALDIKNPLRIKSLGRSDIYLLLGTYVSDNVTKTELIKWNTWSTSFQNSNPINEVGINAFIPGDNILFVQAGLFGRFYYYDPNFNRLESFKSIPGNYSPIKYGTVYPSAVANLNNIVLIGFSNLVGNPADQGVYRIGRHSRNYPYILDFPYPISLRNDDGDFELSDIEIGAMAIRGFDVFVTWRKTNAVGETTVGVDKLDYNAKLDGAILETRVLNPVNRLRFANYSEFYTAYHLLPTSCDIEMYTAKNYADYVAVSDKKNDTDRNLVLSDNLGIEATSLQAKIVARVNGNDAPEIESAALVLR